MTTISTSTTTATYKPCENIKFKDRNTVVTSEVNGRFEGHSL